MNDKTGVGYRFIHTAIDDRTRLAYGQIVSDEQAVTASEFWARAEQRPQRAYLAGPLSGCTVRGRALSQMVSMVRRERVASAILRMWVGLEVTMASWRLMAPSTTVTSTMSS